MPHFYNYFFIKVYLYIKKLPHTAKLKQRFYALQNNNTR